ncbi:hypothetical protein B0J12DRAFT_455982 [Macrophomina phaseolina]|uniref:Uncharacterized protein n=1 Tax=Macrophomina phaseolina TaxID=35725 RepID=A0ABQ8GFY4_9PEZI|nr:hypothetical protein B0J12DRAFT_455982 [Macrophomina phaseolina]
MGRWRELDLMERRFWCNPGPRCGNGLGVDLVGFLHTPFGSVWVVARREASGGMRTGALGGVGRWEDNSPPMTGEQARLLCRPKDVQATQIPVLAHAKPSSRCTAARRRVGWSRLCRCDRRSPRIQRGEASRAIYRGEAGEGSMTMGVHARCLVDRRELQSVPTLRLAAAVSFGFCRADGPGDRRWVHQLARALLRDNARRVPFEASTEYTDLPGGLANTCVRPNWNHAARVAEVRAASRARRLPCRWCRQAKWETSERGKSSTPRSEQGWRLGKPGQRDGLIGSPADSGRPTPCPPISRGRGIQNTGPAVPDIQDLTRRGSSALLFPAVWHPCSNISVYLS